MISKSPLKNSFYDVLFNVKYDNFYLNLNSIEVNSEIDKWISEYQPFLNIGEAYNGDPTLYYYNTNIKLYYNFIINYDVTSAADDMYGTFSKQSFYNPDIYIK